MKTRTTTYVPVFVAVIATAGFGFYLKQSNKTAEQPTAGSRKALLIPKDLRVDIVQMSAGPAPKDLLVPVGGGAYGPRGIDPAAWVRYEVFADGKKRRPERANDRLRFELRDEHNRRWPVRPIESREANYLYVPKGYAVRPESLTLTCKVGTERVLGPWKLPAIGPISKRNLKPSPANAIEKDFPGLKLEVTAAYEPASQAAVIALRIKGMPERKIGENLSVSLYGHEFGVLPPSRNSIVFPEHFVRQMKCFEVSVYSAHAEDETAEVSFPASRIEGPTRGRTIVFPPMKAQPINGGFISFESLPSKSALRLRPNFNMTDQRTSLLKAASSDSVPVKYENGTGLVIEAPDGQTTLPAFKMKITFTRFHEEEKRYVVPITRGEILRSQSMSKSRTD